VNNDICLSDDNSIFSNESNVVRSGTGFSMTSPFGSSTPNFFASDNKFDGGMCVRFWNEFIFSEFSFFFFLE
jgi:hypothetical protein